MSPNNSVKQLVNGFADCATTEELIFFVAGTDNLLSFCRELMDQYDRDPGAPLVREADALCSARGLLPGELFSELRKVLLALNRFHDAGGDHYAILGLEQGASRKEVKHAFRTLSKKHHPDKQKNADRGARRFMEIAGAYHAIMAGAANHATTEPKAWRNTRRNTSRNDRRPGGRMFFIGLGITITVLAWASIFLTAQYHERVNAGRIQQMRLYDTRAPEPATPATQTTSLAEALVRAATDNPAPSPDIPPEGEPTAQALSYGGVTGKTPRNRPVETATTIRPTRPAPVPDLIRPEDVRPAVPAATAAQASSRKMTASVPEKPPGQTDAGQQAHARKISAINTSLEISTLVREFSILYSRRDLTPFLNLFADQATENGEPLSTVIAQYRSLFTHTRAINLVIADINWQSGDNGTILAKGAFTVSYTYNDNRTRTHHGTISFKLIRRRQQLKIKALNYTFN